MLAGNITGLDQNAVLLMGRCTRALRLAGLSQLLKARRGYLELRRLCQSKHSHMETNWCGERMVPGRDLRKPRGRGQRGCEHTTKQMQVAINKRGELKSLPP